MKRPKIVAEYSVPYLRGVIEELGEVTYLPSSDFTRETIRDADWLIVRSITKCTRQLLEDSRVRLVTTATIGFDHIDTTYCESAGITWRNAPGCNAEAVGQYFAGAISRLVVEKGFEPKGKVLGIVGVGHVGKVVKRYAEAFGMKCLLNDPPRAAAEGEEGFVSLGEIARRSDIITLHTPLTKEGEHPTFHLFDKTLVDRLERKPVVINACRGPVSDTVSLLEGLDKGKIDEIIIDCWEGEPDISNRLLERAFIATPHIAGFSADGKANGARMCVEEGLKFFGIDRHDLLSQMTPPPPSPAEVDMSCYEDQRLYRALLATFDPRKADATFRKEYTEFERLRREYDYPREPHAYHFLNADEGQKKQLQLLLP
ncbi:4-phosphoerythronate dehydrogenase PdxB [Porphyromonas sp.]|uniref:4-phosphoerythronate dehydrogenase PdxB n=1 Tax=Porphyromonas sp. TaxID=1924944 RepID=UPI0026DB7FE6|nr:4-phosphoerythronate dehydrogenase PdxB [Porphyromonas sp.]MDO4771116.1 4-phosphoerythronate dehydrogenase PdxB [Porphyromonas sp.]